MKTDDSSKKGLQDFRVSLKNRSPVILAILGVVLIFLGGASIPYLGLYFSPQAAILVILGCIALAISFVIHSEVTRQSPSTEKLSVILISAAIMLVAIAAVIYMIVHVDWVFITVERGGPNGGSAIAAVPMISHIYVEYTAVLVLIAIGLVANALYIKSRMP